MGFMMEITAVLLKMLDGEEIAEEEKNLARDYLTSLAAAPAMLGHDDEVGFRMSVPRMVGDHTIYEVSHFRPAGKGDPTNLTPGAYVIATTGVGSTEFATYWLTYFPVGVNDERWIITAGSWAGTRRAAELALADRVRSTRGIPREITEEITKGKAAHMTNTEDYPYIRAWGRNLGSHGRYIEEQVALARKMGAPQNATYERDGVWNTTDHIQSDGTREQLGLPPLAVTIDNIYDLAAEGGGRQEITKGRRGDHWVAELRFDELEMALTFAKWLANKVHKVDLAEPLHSLTGGAVLEVTLRVPEKQ